MLEIASARVPDAGFVQADALRAAVRRRHVRARLHEPLLRPPRGGRARAASSPRPAASHPSWSSSTRRSATTSQPVEWQERVLNDGSRWQVYKRFFEPGELAASSAAARALRRPLVRRRPRVTVRKSSYRSSPRSSATTPAAAPASKPATRSSRGRCGRPTTASARTSSARRPGSSRARSGCRGAAAPARRCAAGSGSTGDELYETFYCASVTRCYPGRPPSGRGDRTPTPREQELCAFWRDWELELLRPELIVTVGGLALRRLLGLATLTEAIGKSYTLARLGDAIVIPLPHPSGASGWLNDRREPRAARQGADAREAGARAATLRERVTPPGPVPPHVRPPARLPAAVQGLAGRLDDPRRPLAGGGDRDRPPRRRGDRRDRGAAAARRRSPGRRRDRASSASLKAALMVGRRLISGRQALGIEKDMREGAVRAPAAALVRLLRPPPDRPADVARDRRPAVGALLPRLRPDLLLPARPHDRLGDGRALRRRVAARADRARDHAGDRRRRLPLQPRLAPGAARGAAEARRRRDGRRGVDRRRPRRQGVRAGGAPPGASSSAPRAPSSTQTVRAFRQRALYVPLLSFLPLLAQGAVLLAAGRMVVERLARPAQFFVFNLLLAMLIVPLRSLGMWIGQAQRATASGERIFEVMDEPEGVDDRPGAVELPRGAGRDPLRGRHLRATRRAGPCSTRSTSSSRRDGRSR